MNRILVVAEMALREIVRRRGVLLLLVLLPLLFYYSRRDEAYWQSVRMVTLGIGFTLSTAALFAGMGARTMDPRLRLSGYSASQLYLGRLVALWAVGCTVCVPFFLLIRLDIDHVRYEAVVLLMALTVAVSAPLGLAVSALLPRELEGMLVLLSVVCLQILLNPDKTVAHVLPFWFSREIGTYAIEHDAGTGYVTRGCLHAAITFAVLLILVGGLSSIRLRRRAHLSTA
ncbi:ABC transporter permease [Actinoplanes sp. TFC3]|uniref:ABC transporter permease n=1 Tax=Actinoplanes sp. TFC3 TaxID=1710355 RepID=UPI00082B6089|nr:ABC transporter permease [Actinoplanes sp. TFC3]